MEHLSIGGRAMRSPSSLDHGFIQLQLANQPSEEAVEFAGGGGGACNAGFHTVGMCTLSLSPWTDSDTCVFTECNDSVVRFADVNNSSVVESRIIPPRNVTSRRVDIDCAPATRLRASVPLGRDVWLGDLIVMDG
jgi:hypothetical protein